MQLSGSAAIGLCCLLCIHFAVTAAVDEDTSDYDNTTNTCREGCLTEEFLKQTAFDNAVFRVIAAVQEADLQCRLKHGIDFYNSGAGCRDCQQDCNPPSRSMTKTCFQKCGSFMEKQKLTDELQQLKTENAILKEQQNVTATTVVALAESNRSLQTRLEVAENQLISTISDFNRLSSKHETDQQQSQSTSGSWHIGTVVVVGVLFALIIVVIVGVIVSHLQLKKYARETFRPKESTAQHPTTDQLAAQEENQHLCNENGNAHDNPAQT
ncbi:uncharacterized protein LOC143454292 isoform X1 [Clavelina lepadiformis]|uniref:uncharacterized protein LOC143454292 isoform X1 n=1 Tax=Clavelina lepadiformis TaxID=159417 RepID=UPI0040423F29